MLATVFSPLERTDSAPGAQRRDAQLMARRSTAVFGEKSQSNAAPLIISLLLP